MEQHNTSIPPILYGAACKEDDTKRLMIQALTLGFKSIDTANQRRHYFEEGVGLGIQQFLKSSQKTRGDLVSIDLRGILAKNWD